MSKNNAKNISGLEIFGSNWKAAGKQEGSVMFRQSGFAVNSFICKIRRVPSSRDAMPAWRSKVPNATQGSLGSLVSLKAWQDYQFCNVHKTGFFCDGTTRIRCCKLEDGYAKCGSTANSGTCGAEKPDLSKLKSLGFYKTRQASSFCQKQPHVGTYCYKNRYVYCCKYGAGVVECQPQHQSGRWCMDVFV